jgi:hypothetical protein
LVTQFFLSLRCDLLVHALLPTKDLNHPDYVRDLGNALNTRIRLTQ